MWQGSDWRRIREVFREVLPGGDDFHSFRYRGHLHVPVGGQPDGVSPQRTWLAGVRPDAGLRVAGRGGAPVCVQEGSV